jgi:general transcription factor 3C polypeptide 3 (transcription factor C subunit 4)
MQTNPFRGMLPRTRQRKQPVQTEADEDRMASRLQLDLERDTLSRKYKAADKQGSINIFRGVSFDEWLRVIIQVTRLEVLLSGICTEATA